MMSEYVPLTASGPTQNLIIELAVLPGKGWGAGGVKVTVTCAGTPVTFNVTFWLNVAIEVTVTTAVLHSVALISRKFGETDIPKSDGRPITFKVTRTDLGLREVDDGGYPVILRT